MREPLQGGPRTGTLWPPEVNNLTLGSEIAKLLSFLLLFKSQPGHFSPFASNNIFFFASASISETKMVILLLLL